MKESCVFQDIKVLQSNDIYQEIMERLARLLIKEPTNLQNMNLVLRYTDRSIRVASLSLLSLSLRISTT